MEVRGYVSANIFRPIYNAIFDSHLNYDTFVWGQNANAIKRNIFSKKKTLRLMNVWPRNFQIFPLFLSLNILKLPDKVFLGY